MNLNRLKQFLRRKNKNFRWKQLRSNPLTKIILINSAILIAWKVKLFPENFLVKHFSFQRFNVRKYRWHTFITYAFSHFSYLSYAFNMLTLYFFGRALQINYSNKYIWILYLTGALFGSLSMNYFMPYYTILMPQVGADASISSIITFYALSNLNQKVFLFLVPVPMWTLLLLMGTYSFVLDPSKKNFGGMMAGLMVYQMMRFRFI